MKLLLLGEKLRRDKKKKINRSSIKEAVDTLPIAVCYFSDSGVVKLCNLQMEKLFWSIAQTDLQYFDEFKVALDACDQKSGIMRLTHNRDIYIFPDGKVWHYLEKKIKVEGGKCYTEAIFTNVTELYEKSLELTAQTTKLREIAKELKKLSDNALILTKENEILSAKTRLHDQMGAGLIAVRQSLQHKNHPEEADAAIQLFRKAVSIIKNDNDYSLEHSDWAECVKDAETIGIKMKLSGSLPEKENILRVVMIAIRECLTNAARHADAKELEISVTEDNKEVTLIITNDGKKPTEEIRPKGGLLNLARHLVGMGGTMKIQSVPVFVLTVTIPYRKENVL